MTESVPVYRVRNWDQLYENNRSREMKQTNWFPLPNDLSADGFVELVADDNGPAHLGVWIALLMVASRARRPRGSLIREDGRPHTAESLARVTRLPQHVIQAAVDRLLQIGLLEITGSKPRKSRNLRSHPSAAKPQEPAAGSQEGAAEGKGREHHQQEGNFKEKKGKRTEANGTEPKGTERADAEFSDERSPAPDLAKAPFFQRRPDDDDQPATQYASATDELKAIYLKKAGETVTIEVLDAIRVNLGRSGVSMSDFVSEVRKHAENEWRNPAGFLRDLSKRFCSKTRPASAPLTAAEAEERDYKCELCGSRKRGEGVLPGPDGTLVPCECATTEYIARQRARGVFPPEYASS